MQAARVHFSGSEIYGGLQGTYDYGPLGVELKNNLKRLWWRHNVYERDDMEGIETAILMNKNVWKYSGHEVTFTDPLVDCKTCKLRFREDKAADAICLKHPKLHPGECEGELTEPRGFNLMFKTQVGPVADEDSFAYLRPETAQGMFVNSRTCWIPPVGKSRSASRRLGNRSAMRSRRAISSSASASWNKWRWSILCVRATMRRFTRRG